MSTDVRFEHPPVQRVVQTIWFEPLKTLRTLDLAELRVAWSNEFPALEELAPLPGWMARVYDKIIGPEDRWPVPACIFLSSDRDRQILVQADRVSVSWNFNTDDKPYPGFVELASALSRTLSDFISTVKKNSNPDPSIERATLEYINILKDVDVMDVAEAVILNRQIEPSRIIRDGDSIQLVKHYCPTEENRRVTTEVSVREASESDEHHEGAGTETELRIFGHASVPKESNYKDCLTDLHRVILDRFLLLAGDDIRKSWGGQVV